MIRETIVETYSKAARETDQNFCCGVDYRKEFSQEEIRHLPEEVLNRNYGCGVPPGLRKLAPGQHVLDLGPGFGRDCFIAALKVGPGGRVFGLDMNEDMLAQAERYRPEVVGNLGYDNISFLRGQFDRKIPLPDDSIDVILSNCVNNLALDKRTAYREMFRVLSPGKQLSFSDVVSYHPLPEQLRSNEAAWADCVGGVLSFGELAGVLSASGFHGVTLTTEYLWKAGNQIVEEYCGAGSLSEQELQDLGKVRLYSVAIEAFKPILDPQGECYWRGQYALFHGPGVALQLDNDPDHVFTSAQLKEVCEKTATILKSEPFNRYFTVFEPEGEVEARLCVPGDICC